MMSLLSSFAGLCGVAIPAIAFAGLGRFLLDRAHWDFRSRIEGLLVCLATGVLAFELLVSLGELWPNTRLGVCAAVVLAGAIGLPLVPKILKDLWSLAGTLAKVPAVERWLALAIGGVLFLEGFASMAPLTGSDALHYHFTVPLLILKEGFHPNWFLPHSFFTGMSHQLILAGLALGSEKLAMGWIFLGGAAAAGVAAYLTRQWVAGVWPYLAALAFLLTPVAFWQITTAGAPDVWMALFVPVGVLAIARAKENPAVAATCLAGAMAGGVAGTKYTGLILAACLFAAFVAEVRRLRGSLIFLAAAGVTGIWPYLRNWLWSGDPLFPFLMRHLVPDQINQTALAGMLADTGASAPRNFWQIVRFPFFAALDPANLGFWQLLGPLVLAFAPLVLLAVRRTALWRIALIVWIVGALGIGLSSGMMRFLLPLLPIALAAVMAGIAQLPARRWRGAFLFAQLSVAGFLVFGFGGLVLYARNSWAVSAGLTTRESYLRLHAPDYPRSEFVNEQLAGKENGGRALVFLAHLYYLKVPFVYGDPNASWAMDPDQLRSDDEWRSLFSRYNIRWVVRGGEYPPKLSEPLNRLEREDILIPCASGTVEDLFGNRIGGMREAENMTILCTGDDRE